MALKLQRECKGISADYWKIVFSNYDAIINKTNITLALYASKEARGLGINNDLDRTTYQFDGFLTLAESYAKIKESKVEQRVVAPAVTEGSMIDGTLKIITPAVIEDYESNPFSLATDC